MRVKAGLCPVYIQASAWMQKGDREEWNRYIRRTGEAAIKQGILRYPVLLKPGELAPEDETKAPHEASQPKDRKGEPTL